MLLSRNIGLGFALFAITLLQGSTLRAADMPTFELTIKDHKFEPAEIMIPKDTKVKLVVKNLDPTPEEFESDTLRREKIVAGKSEITVFVGPLDPGRYEFYGDFNQKTARGAVIAKP